MLLICQHAALFPPSSLHSLHNCQTHRAQAAAIHVYSKTMWCPGVPVTLTHLSTHQSYTYRPTILNLFCCINSLAISIVYYQVAVSF